MLERLRKSSLIIRNQPIGDHERLLLGFGVVSIAALPAIIGAILLIRDANRSNQ